jgi:hypothetical protein
MTATRSGSTPHSGQPASVNAARAAESAHCWPMSIWSATFGGTGRRHPIGSHGNSRTQPPMREYVLSGAFGSGS